MTLVAALTGHEGVAFFADTQESTGYAKKSVDKLCVYDSQHQAFRFAIAGATDDATYVDALQTAMATCLAKVDGFDLRAVTDTLTKTLTDFYSNHVWPRPDRPKMEYLIVVQPLPKGMPEVFHVSETVVNIMGITTHQRAIGVGCYLAEYLFNALLGGGEPLAQLAAAAIYVAGEVRDNIEGCGQVDRIALFDSCGNYDELDFRDIEAIEKNLSASTKENLKYVFDSITDVSEFSEENLKDYLEAITDGVKSAREKQLQSYKEWQDRHKRRVRLLKVYAKRAEKGMKLS